MEQKHIDSFLALADGLRFKLWAIVGKDNDKKKDIIKEIKRLNKNLTYYIEFAIMGSLFKAK